VPHPRTARLGPPLALLLTFVLSGTAVAALPRTYTVQRVDNPTPAINDRFGDGLVNAGDVNGDGEDDILVGIDEHAQIAGEVFVFSGEDGSLIRRIPPPPADADPGGAGDNPDAFGTFVGRIASIGQCPNFTGQPGDDCNDPNTSGTFDQTVVDTPDTVPDQLVSAIGVDVVNGDDMGMGYVIDGATGAVLKRLRMPAGDRAAQATNSPTASQGPGFGRTIIAPTGLPPCAGNGGIGTCPPVGAPSTGEPYAQPTAVRIGDLNNGGRADIVIGASDFTEAAASNPLCTTGTCFQTGRFYAYRGEDLVGVAAGTPLETPMYTIKNPAVQTDDATVNSRFHREATGYSVAPVGDLGSCTSNTTPIAGGDNPSAYFCLNTANSTTEDGRPEFIASSHRVDTSGMGDVGLAYAIDGPTGRILDVYNHPEPQVSSIFAFSNYNQPAVGDLGSNTKPDIYQGAMIQNVANRAQGRGYALSGDFRFGGSNHYLFGVFDDPTPNQIGNFGTSSAGVGNVSGDGRNELAIGAYGPHAPQVIEEVISDVHIFSALGDHALQTIPDPDQDPGGGFGRSLAPLGDLNEDGFLDFVVGAGGYGGGTCSPCSGTTPGAAQGRLYILRSDNSPAPTTTPPAGPPAGPQGPAGPPGPAGGVTALAGRTLELARSRGSLRRGQSVLLRGTIEAFANASRCEPGQQVLLQSRAPGRSRYRTLARLRTNRAGDFQRRLRPLRTAVYRARVEQTAECLGAVSNRELVGVRAARRR
jgi:FG-GAP repeat